MMTSSRFFLVLVVLLAFACATQARPAPAARPVAFGRSLASQLSGHAGSDRLGGDMPGSPLSLDIGAEASTCAQLCLDTSGCVAWAFEPSTSSPRKSFISHPQCFLKDTVGPVSGHETRTSGTPYVSLLPPRYPKLPASAFLPRGWLRVQTEIQRDGLAGHLQLFWPEVADSEFIGGHHDTPATNHERFVYWLNGQATMGHLAQDPAMAYTIWNYTDYLLRNQSADGFLGPRENPDPWPRQMIMYSFQQYAEVNASDTRVVPAMHAYMQFLWKQYTNSTFRPQQWSWNYVRIQDMQTSVEWLYDFHATPEQQQFLLDLNELIYNKSDNWKTYYRSSAFPHDDVANRGTMLTHGVNSGMGLKSAAVWYRQTADPDDLASSRERVMQMDQYHGQASGIFSCDEHLAGRNPSRGTEMCTVVEAMFSYSTMFSIQGDLELADRVESLMFNALPATQTRDWWAHQYLQQSNEINSEVQRDWWWNSDGGDSNLYGLEPNYGCCTANHPQGLPKFLTAQYMLTQESGLPHGILAALLGPSSVHLQLTPDNLVTIEQDTLYPFAINPTIRFHIRGQKSFPFSMRVPGWAIGATLTDGAKVVPVANGSVYTYPYTPASGGANTTIELRLPTSFRVVYRFNNAVSVYYGPLLMALNISSNASVLRQYAYKSQDLAFMPTSSWNLALQLNLTDLQSSFEIKQAPIPRFPFDPISPALTVSAYARQIDWPMKHSGADEPPMSPVKSTQPLIPVTLIPYGATVLRLAEIPWLGPSSSNTLLQSKRLAAQ